MVFRRLAYISRVQVPANRVLDEWEAIGGVSQRNNADRGLTGILACDGMFFGQVIEGHDHSIDALFARIRQDARHRDVRVMCYDPTRERRFPRWAMAMVLAPHRRLGLGRFHARPDLGDADWFLDTLADAALRDGPAVYGRAVEPVSLPI